MAAQQQYGSISNNSIEIIPNCKIGIFELTKLQPNTPWAPSGATGVSIAPFALSPTCYTTYIYPGEMGESGGLYGEDGKKPSFFLPNGTHIGQRKYIATKGDLPPQAANLPEFFIQPQTFADGTYITWRLTPAPQNTPGERGMHGEIELIWTSEGWRTLYLGPTNLYQQGVLIQGQPASAAAAPAPAKGPFYII